MKFLRANAPRLSINQIAAFAAEHYGLTGDVTTLYSERDQNLRLREASGAAWVLKVASAEEDPGIIACQLATMQHIERVDQTLPVPRVCLARDGTANKHIVAPDGTRHVFYVLSFLEGEIVQRSDIDHALHGRIGEMLARLGRAMRRLFHPAAGNRELLWDVRMLDRLLPHAELFGSGWQRDRGQRIGAHFIDQVRPQISALRSQLIHGNG